MVYKSIMCVGVLTYLFALSTYYYFLSAILTTLVVPLVILVSPHGAQSQYIWNGLLLLCSTSGLYLMTSMIDGMTLKWYNGMDQWIQDGDMLYPALWIGHQWVILSCTILVNSK